MSLWYHQMRNQCARREKLIHVCSAEDCGRTYGSYHALRAHNYAGHFRGQEIQNFARDAGWEMQDFEVPEHLRYEVEREMLGMRTERRRDYAEEHNQGWTKAPVVKTSPTPISVASHAETASRSLSTSPDFFVVPIIPQKRKQANDSDDTSPSTESKKLEPPCTPSSSSAKPFPMTPSPIPKRGSLPPPSVSTKPLPPQSPFCRTRNLFRPPPMSDLKP